jgi:1-acyl-sn-glycerol-3-phosphate acyltransferase
LNWLDSFTIQLAFPAEPRLHFLAAPDLLVKRRLQWWIVRKTGGYVPVDRRKHFDTALFRHVYQCLELGGAIVIFPEANYGQHEGELLPFRNGFAHFALRSGAPVVPVALSGTKDLWLRKRIRVAIGRPIQPAAMNVESLVSTGRESITNLLPAYLEPAGPKLLRRWLTDLF